jgi:hypothetical protein
MIPAMVFQWSGRHMIPRHTRLAESSFTSGHTYRLGIVAERETGRTAEQNAKMWAMLSEISEQIEHAGHKYDPDRWKALFMHACGHEVQFLPLLDGKGFMPYFHSSRKLSKKEFAALLDFITEWAAAHDVHFADLP